MTTSPETEVEKKSLAVPRSFWGTLKARIWPEAISYWLAGESLTRRAFLNAIAASLDYASRLVVGFAVNPLLVAGLGDYAYGVWQVLGRMIDYMSPATGRPTQALKWTLANQQASSDYEDKRRQVGYAIAVWALFLPMLALLAVVMMWFAPLWLHAPTTFSPTVRLASGLLVANLIMLSLVEVPRSVLEGQNLGYKRMGMSAALVFVGGGLLALAAKLNTGLVGAAASRLATTTLTGLLFFQIVRSYVPWFGVAKPEFQAVRRFLGLSGWFLFWNLVMKLMTASDVVVLGVLDSAELVTTYTLAKYVPETIINFVAMVVFGITPGLGGIIGSGDLGRATRVRSEIMAFSWLVVTALGSTISMWNSTFVRLWVGPQYALGPLPTLLVILMVMQFVIIRNDANIIDLTLNLRRKVLIGLLSAGISLALAVVLVGYFKTGIVGMCIGFLTGRLILTVTYPWLVGRHLEIRFGSQIRSAIRPALVAGVLFGLPAVLQTHVAVNTWYGLIFWAGITLIVVSVIAAYTGLSQPQRAQLGERVREVLRQRKSKVT